MSEQKQSDNTSSIIEDMENIELKIKKCLGLLNKLHNECDFVSAKLRYAYTQKNELIKGFIDGNGANDGDKKDEPSQ